MRFKKGTGRRNIVVYRFKMKMVVGRKDMAIGLLLEEIIACNCTTVAYKDNFGTLGIFVHISVYIGWRPAGSDPYSISPI